MLAQKQFDLFLELTLLCLFVSGQWYSGFCIATGEQQLIWKLDCVCPVCSKNIPPCFGIDALFVVCSWAMIFRVLHQPGWVWATSCYGNCLDTRGCSYEYFHHLLSSASMCNSQKKTGVSAASKVKSLNFNVCQKIFSSSPFQLREHFPWLNHITTKSDFSLRVCSIW